MKIIDLLNKMFKDENNRPTVKYNKKNIYL